MKDVEDVEKCDHEGKEAYIRIMQVLLILVFRLHLMELYLGSVIGGQVLLEHRMRISSEKSLMKSALTRTKHIEALGKVV